MFRSRAQSRIAYGLSLRFVPPASRRLAMRRRPLVDPSPTMWRGPPARWNSKSPPSNALPPIVTGSPFRQADQRAQRLGLMRARTTPAIRSVLFQVFVRQNLPRQRKLQYFLLEFLIHEYAILSRIVCRDTPRQGRDIAHVSQMVICRSLQPLDINVAGRTIL
jgi:hypothetical protein